MKKISIIIPALNEEKRLPTTLSKLSKYLRYNLRNYDHEVIIVVPVGRDNTLDAAKDGQKLFECEYRIIEPGPKVGKGRDVRAGMLEATGDKIIFMDADLATPLHHLPEMVAKINSKNQICIGERKLNEFHTSKIRSLVSMLGNLSSKLLIGVYYEDTQCGFKGFTKDAVKTVFGLQTIMGWAFDIEILAIAKIRNINVATIFIHDWEDVEGGNLTDSVISSSIYTFGELLKIRKNIILKKY